MNQLFPVQTHSALQFEKELNIEYHGFLIVGYMDIWNSASNEVWELKMVSTIDPIHLLQVAIYRWMLAQSSSSVTQCCSEKFHVYNIRDGTHYQITASLEQLTNIVDRLIQYKRNEQKQQSDHDFLKMF